MRIKATHQVNGVLLSQLSNRVFVDQFGYLQFKNKLELDTNGIVTLDSEEFFELPEEVFERLMEIAKDQIEASGPIIAAGGNSTAARKLRVKSQLRDSKGRWIEMGRQASISVKINGKKTKVTGTFVGADPKAPGERGFFIVEADEARGIERAVYSFKGKAVTQILASLDPEYLKEQGIVDPVRDVNNNLNGSTLDEDIENLEDVYREEVGELDEALSSGKLSGDEVAQAFRNRNANAEYESYNVVATLEEADTEVLTRDQLQNILKDAGVPRGEDAPRRVNFDEAERRASRDSEVGLVERSRSRTTDGREVKVGDPTFGAELIYVDPPAGFGRGLGRLVWQNPDGSLIEYNPSTHGMVTQTGQRGLNQPDPNAGRSWTGDPEVITYDKPRAKRKPKAEKAPEPTTAITRAESLIPGDEVKMPDGSFKVVKRNFSTDSGPRIDFEDGTVVMYDSDDTITLKLYPEESPLEPLDNRPVLVLPTDRREGGVLFNPGAVERPRLSQDDVDNLVEKARRERDATRPPVEEAQAPEERKPEWNNEKVAEVLKSVRDFLNANKTSFAGLDIEGFTSQESNDPDVKEAIDMAYYMSDIIERSGSDDEEKEFLYLKLAQALKNNQRDKARLKSGDVPTFTGNADTVRKITARKDGATIDPIQMKQPRTGIAVALADFNEEIADTLFFDPYLGDLIVADYIDRNRDKLEGGNFKLGTWHDVDNNEVTFDLVEVFPKARLEEAKIAGQDRNQQGIFDLATKEYIPTDGTGDRGRARREREEQRQASDRSGAGPELGEPDASGEGRQGEELTPSDAQGNGAQGERVALERPESTDSITIDDRKEVNYPEMEFDASRLNTKQRQLIKKLSDSKKRLMDLVLKSAKERDIGGYERNLNWSKAINTTFKRVFGSLSSGEDLTFGKGEEERLKNMTFFTNTLSRNEATNQITKLEGVYVARNGEAFSLSYDPARDGANRAGVYRINPDGTKGPLVARVDINWTGEAHRLDSGPQAASISYLKSEDEGKGLAGVAVTFARYIAESSGREFAHSRSLTPEGANNSKGIEPGDPRRHNASQSEKILQLMKAPTMDVLEKQGWFTGDFKLSSSDSWADHRLFEGKGFLTPLDMRGQKTNAAKMVGPVNILDDALFGLYNAYRNNDFEDHPEFIKEFAENGSAVQSKLRLQFAMEELNWKDGPSKEEIIKKLKDTEDFIEYAKEAFRKKEERNELLGSRSFGGERGAKKIDLLASNVRSIREGLEADTDFDSKRLDRPKSIDLSLPNQVELRSTAENLPDNQVKEFEEVPLRYNLHEFDNLSRYGSYVAVLDRGTYEAGIGNEPPAGWTSAPSVLARRFSVEQLKEALDSSLLELKNAGLGNGTDVYAELDFRREFADEPVLAPITILAVARALYIKSPKVDGVDFKEYLSERIDRAYGVDSNISKIDKASDLEGDFFREMDDYLESVGQPRLGPVEQEILDLAPTSPDTSSSPFPRYNKETGTVLSFGLLSQSDRQEAMESVAQGSLQENELFEDLPNGLGEILTEPASEIPLEQLENIQRNGGWRVGGGNNSPKGIAQDLAERYRRGDLIEAFKDAVKKGNTTVKFEIQKLDYRLLPDGFGEFELDIKVLRDTLQLINVDTNGLIRSQVLSDIPELTEAQIIELNRNGRMQEVSAADIINQVNEVVDISSFDHIRDFGMGGSGVTGLYEDPATGKKYVVKLYQHKFVAEMEIATQALYRAAGIYASNPRFGYESSNPSGVYVVTDFVEGNDNRSYVTQVSGAYGPESKAVSVEAVRNGLAMDILLDNIDGPYNTGNIVYTADGGLIRIDGGGGLLADPTPAEGDKRGSRRYSVTSPNGYRGEPSEEQKRLIDITDTDGSFEGRGIEYTYDLFLNVDGLHWNDGAGARDDILDGFDEDVFKQTVKESLDKLTPQKITRIIDGMPFEESYKARIKEALIYRRGHMLARFGITDSFDQQAVDFSVIEAGDADRARLANYVDSVISKLSVDEIFSYREISSKRTTSKKQIEDAIEELKLISSEREDELEVRPAMDFGEPASRAEKVSELLNAQEEKPDTDDLPTGPLPEPIIGSSELSSVDVDDVIENAPDTTYNGRVIFNVRGDSNTYQIGIRDSAGKLNVFNYSPSSGVKFVAVRRSNGDTPSETNFDPNLQASRDRYLGGLKSRSNKVLDAIKNKYVNHSQLSNGDLVVSSRVFTTAGGRTYKYQVVVHRKADEEFVAYAREWEIGRDGGAITPVRINKMTTPTHSPRALLNRIAPLIQGPGVGQGLYGRNPRNWFNQGRSIESEVIDPRTGMPIPRSLGGEPGVQYVGDTGIRTTGDPAKDAVIAYVGKLVSRGVSASDVFRRLSDNGVIRRADLLDIIERVEATRAFPGINQVPYLSRNKRDVVRVGDRVRHYMPDGTVKEGVVRLRRALTVNRKPNGDYEYTDVLVVKFDGRAQGTPIVAKNLEVISRRDGEAPDLGGEPVAPLVRSLSDEVLPELPENWRGVVSSTSFARFEGPDDAPMITLHRLPGLFGRGDERFFLNEYPSIDEGRTSRVPARRTIRFSNLQNAILTAENIVKNYEEKKLEKGEATAPPSFTPKVFDGLDFNLQDFGDAIERSPGESPCALNASAVEVCKITKAMRYKVVENPPEGGEEGYTEVTFGEMEDVDSGLLPTFRVYKTFFGIGRKTRKVLYWTNPNDVGNDDKARKMEIPKGLTVDEAAERIRKNAEERIEFSKGIPAGKNSRTLTIDLGGGESLVEDVDFETWKGFSLSPVSRSHFSLGANGVINIDEGRQKYYQQQVAFHLQGIEPPEGRAPVMYVFGGSPASGKGGFTKAASALAKAVKGDTPATKEFNSITGLESTADGVTPTAVLVDPDVFKIRLPEVRVSHLRQLINRVVKTAGLKQLDTNRAGDQGWANNSHEESSLMAKMLTKAAQEKGLDIVLDGVNAEKSKVAKKASQAREKGYKVVGRYLEAAFEVTMPAAATRGFNTGREVPLDVQLSSLKHLTESLTDEEGKSTRIWEVFDDFELFNRTGSTINEIATWRPGQESLNFINVDGNSTRAMELHAEYVSLAQLSKEERDARIKKIKRQAQADIKTVKDRSKKLSEGDISKLAKAEDALAKDIELEVMALTKAIEVRYPSYGSLSVILNNLVQDLESGKISDKEFGQLVGVEMGKIKKGSSNEENITIAEAARVLTENVASLFIREKS